MTKIDIVENIYEKVDYSKREVLTIVETVFDIIKETLRHEDKSWSADLGNSLSGTRRPGEVEIQKRGVIWRLVQEGS